MANSQDISPIDYEDYIIETMRLGVCYYNAYKVLVDRIHTVFDTELLFPASFCASQSAELFLKASIVRFTHDVEKVREFKYHHLKKLLKELKLYDESVKSLSQSIAVLEKYSGVKMRYIESYIGREILFGTDETSQISKIKTYAEKLLSQ